MPIYEYQCGQCGRVSNFLVRSVATHQAPACPKCGQPALRRLFSRFAAVHGGKPSSGADRPDDAAPAARGAEPAPGGPTGFPDLPEAELAALEKDPRHMGRLMRRMAEQAGGPVPPEMNEVLRRLESGENPDKIEEQMGELFGGGEGGGPGADDDTLYDG